MSPPTAPSGTSGRRSTSARRSTTSRAGSPGAGRPVPLLVSEVGDVAGKDLLHLQCHFGLDTLAWARRGARVTGADISERAIEQARVLAGETGLDGRFVVSDVVDLPDNLEGDFDVVFTSFGALNWLPDLPRWAEVVAHFVRPGGFFYIAEAHPFAWTFDDDDTATELRLRYHYWPSPDPLVFPNEGSYADPTPPWRSRSSTPGSTAWARSSPRWRRPGCASSTSTSTPGSPGRCSPSWSSQTEPPSGVWPAAGARSTRAAAAVLAQGHRDYETLPDLPGRRDHVAQGGQHLRVVAGLEAAVGIDPEPGRADRLQGLLQQRGHLVGRFMARWMS